MAQRRHHYEQAFEAHLRAQRVPYVAVDEARKALLPEAGAMSISVPSPEGGLTQSALKSFDFVIYGKPGGPGAHVLAEVKGRRVGKRSVVPPAGHGMAGAGPAGCLPLPQERRRTEGRRTGNRRGTGWQQAASIFGTSACAMALKRYRLPRKAQFRKRIRIPPDAKGDSNPLPTEFQSVALPG